MRIFAAVCVLAAVTAGAASGAKFNLDRLGAEDIKKVDKSVKALKKFVDGRRSNGGLTNLTFEELYSALGSKERVFVKRFERLDANGLDMKLPYLGVADGKFELVAVRGQKILAGGKSQELPVQYVGPEVWKQYSAMMDAMQGDIGKRLYIQSGYRSSAYQLYLFLASLQRHNYSIRETAEFVALPGYSEHGDYSRQAIDLVSENGIDCQSKTEEFEALAEYKWMTANAGKFGFVLSYPKDSNSGISFEPWHWRYEKSKIKN